KDGGVGADAERQREHDRDGQSPGTPERAPGDAHVLPQVIPPEPAAILVEAFPSPGDIAESPARRGSGGFFPEPVFLLEALGLQLDVGFNLSIEVTRLALASEHRLALLGFENATDRLRQTPPLFGFFAQLLAAGFGERVKPGFAIIRGDTPLSG